METEQSKEIERNMVGIQLAIQDLQLEQNDSRYLSFKMNSFLRRDHRRERNGLHHMLQLTVVYKSPGTEKNFLYGRYEHEPEWFRLNEQWNRIGGPLRS